MCVCVCLRTLFIEMAASMFVSALSITWWCVIYFPFDIIVGWFSSHFAKLLLFLVGSIPLKILLYSSLCKAADNQTTAAAAACMSFVF